MLHKYKLNSDTIAMIFWHFWVIKNQFRIVLLKKLIYMYCHISGVKLGEKATFNGFPVIYRFRESRIVIGSSCTFNSAKSSGIIGPIKPCSFITLNPNSKIIIGNNVGITGCLIIAATSIEIGNNVLIGANCSIFDTDFHNAGLKKGLTDTSVPSKRVIIKENVFIGANCTILKGVIIGQNSAISAGSVVVNDIPADSIAIGNPCKVVIRKRMESPAI